jgi:hypothetical protein
VEAGATTAQSSPLHHHNRYLRPRHTTVFWRDLRPLPLTDRLTGRWTPRSPMPLHEVVGDDCVPSMVGISPTGLHQIKDPCHRAIRGRRREEKKKTTSATSRWSPASFWHWRYARWHATPSVNGTNPKDHWRHGPQPCCQPC